VAVARLGLRRVIPAAGAHSLLGAEVRVQAVAVQIAESAAVAAKVPVVAPLTVHRECLGSAG